MSLCVGDLTIILSKRYKDDYNYDDNNNNDNNNETVAVQTHW